MIVSLSRAKRVWLRRIWSFSSSTRCSRSRRRTAYVPPLMPWSDGFAFMSTLTAGAGDEALVEGVAPPDSAADEDAAGAVAEAAEALAPPCAAFGFGFG